MYLGVMHSTENDVCGVTLSLYPQLKNWPDHGGSGTYEIMITLKIILLQTQELDLVDPKYHILERN